MSFPLHPLVCRCGALFSNLGKGFSGVVEVDFVYAKGVATAHDGRYIVWVVNVVNDQGEVLLSLSESGQDACFSSRSEGHVCHDLVVIELIGY